MIHARRSAGMRTAATARCIIASANLVVVMVPAEKGALNETSKKARAIQVQMVRAKSDPNYKGEWQARRASPECQTCM